MPKYGKPVWQHVFEAAKGLKMQTFSPNDIIAKVHETNPEIPSVTIRSYVLAMAPNHPFSGHWPSTRKLHGLFEYLGEGRLQIKEKVEGKPAEIHEAKRRLWYCSQCGYIAYREAPPFVCPICKAKSKMFKEIKTRIDFIE
jgi:rubrerythrin